MIKFSKFNWLYALISCTVIGFGIFSVVNWGYNVSIDFTGGTTIVYNVTPQDTKFKKTSTQIADFAKTNKFQVISVARNAGDLKLVLKNFNEKLEPQLREFIAKDSGATLKIDSLDSVGPTIGAAAVKKTLIALLLGVFVILAYIFYSFKKFTFAVAAVCALLHDVLVVMGTYSIFCHFFGAQLDTLFVTALLTTMSFSVHDTIIIFDNIRHEILRTHSSNVVTLADQAVTATMVRSINNSLTIIFMLLALTILGGQSIRFFALTLLVGTVTGVYSSPFVATPIMTLLERKFGKK